MNHQQKRTLSGSTEIYADIVDLPSSDNAVRINGVKGTAGQLLKKNDTTNKIEWGDESSITGTAPIAVADGVVSLNSDMGSKSLTTTGTLTAEQLTSTDDITATGHIGCATLTASGDIVAQGDINGDNATNIAFINAYNNLHWGKTISFFWYPELLDSRPFSHSNNAFMLNTTQYNSLVLPPKKKPKK